MTRVSKIIGDRTLVANFSSVTCNATIKLDGVKIFSKMVFGSHKEDVDVEGRTFRIRFSGMIVANVEIDEIVKP